MQNWQLTTSVLIVLLSLTPLANSGVPPDMARGSFSVLKGDINSDGCDDMLVTARGGVVIIEFDGAPLPLAQQDPVKPFMLTSNASCVLERLESPTHEQIKSPVWVESGYTIKVGDVAGLGDGSLFVYPSDSSGAAFNLVRQRGSTTINLIQVIDGPNATSEIAREAEFAYLDSDDRSDIVLSSGSNVIDVYLAGDGGELILEGVENRIVSAKLTWSNFIKRMAAGDVDTALNFIAEEHRENARVAMGSVTADPVSFAASIRRFEIVEEVGGFVRAVVVVSEQSFGDMAYFLTFAKDDDGVWRIVSL